MELESKTTLYIDQNDFENAICKMASILSRPQCVKLSSLTWLSCQLLPRMSESWGSTHDFNSLRPRQNGRHFADDTFKRNFLNENERIFIKISLKFIRKGPVNNIPALVQLMAWRRPGDKPLSEPMVICLLTHICITRPQWVNYGYNQLSGPPLLTWINFNPSMIKWSQAQ